MPVCGRESPECLIVRCGAMPRNASRLGTIVRGAGGSRMFSIVESIRRSATTTFAMLFGALCLFGPTAVEAQARGSSANETQGQGGFPDASFGAMFRKYTPPKNTFSPFYAWDAHMALDLTVFRKGSGAVNFGGFVQTVGRDLDQKLEEERNKGATIPIVDDPSEYDVFFKAYPQVIGLAIHTGTRNSR